MTIDDYETGIAAARERFAGNASIKELFEKPIASAVLHQFLIYFSALGVAMTEPVDRWIRRAGDRCIEIGLPALGRKLRSHARHEEGHHLLMIDDTRWLCAQWNRLYGLQTSDISFLSLSIPASVKAYRDLHEEIITSDSPYGQLTIEYEIEKLSLDYGAPLIKRCIEVLGEEIVSGLSFIKDHVQLDAGHTQFNRRQLSALLAVHPEFLPRLIEAGTRALDAYCRFLGDCLALASHGHLRQPVDIAQAS